MTCDECLNEPGLFRHKSEDFEENLVAISCNFGGYESQAHSLAIQFSQERQCLQIQIQLNL